MRRHENRKISFAHSVHCVLLVSSRATSDARMKKDIIFRLKQNPKPPLLVLVESNVLSLTPLDVLNEANGYSCRRINTSPYSFNFVSLTVATLGEASNIYMPLTKEVESVCSCPVSRGNVCNRTKRRLVGKVAVPTWHCLSREPCLVNTYGINYLWWNEDRD